MSRSETLVQKMDRALYPDFGRNWDDTLFRAEILSVLRPYHVVLDIGAGAGIVPQMNVREHAARVCGVDPNPRVADNPYLHEGTVGVGEHLPYPEATFDVVFADNVLEHLADPHAVFAEVARVLKPGGVFLAKTPNRWHYMPLVSQATPHRFHQWYNRLRGRDADDTFPTHYRANSRKSLKAIARRAGLAVRTIRVVEGRPEYLRFHPVPYALGAAYERLVNATPVLQDARVLLVGVFEKP